MISMKTKTAIEKSLKETEIGLIPSDWDVKGLSEESITDLIMGQSPPSSTYNSEGKGIPFLQGKTDFGRVFPTPTQWCTHPSRIAEKEDILMSVRAPVGDVNIAPYQCVIGRGVAAIRPKQKVSGRYLFLYLTFAKERIESHGTGSIFKSINKSVLQNFQIAIPEFFEQQKISFILSKIQQAIVQQEKIITKTKELKRSLMHQLFTYGLRDKDQKETDAGTMPINWDVVPLGNICTYTTGKLNSNAAKENGQYPFFTCSQETYRIDIYSFDQEALLLAGNNARAVYSVKYYNGKFDAYQRTYVFTIKNKEKCAYRYLLYELTRKLEMLRISSLGTTTKYITAGIISNLQIALPSLDEQEEIATVLQAIDEKINLETNRKNYLSNLFKTVLQLLMTGQVRVKDVDFGEINV